MSQVRRPSFIDDSILNTYIKEIVQKELIEDRAERQELEAERHREENKKPNNFAKFGNKLSIKPVTILNKIASTVITIIP